MTAVSQERLARAASLAELRAAGRLVVHVDRHTLCLFADGDDVYAVQLDVTLRGRLDRHRLRDAVQAALMRHPNLAARFCGDFDAPVQAKRPREQQPRRLTRCILPTRPPDASVARRAS